MSDAHRHPDDELQLLLDGRLAPAKRAAVEAHLRECARCRSALALLQQVRTGLRGRLADHQVPKGLAERAAASLRTEPSGLTTLASGGIARRRWLRWGLGLAAAALLAFALRALLAPGRTGDPVQLALRDFEAVQTGRMSLALETAEPAELERRFVAEGLPFVTRVFDFGMMDLRLLGGRIHRLGGRRSALFAYQSVSGLERTVCQMYEGRLESLPPPLEEREHNGIRFWIYRRGDVTLVFWQEGAVVCVLAAAGAPENVVQLAFAKAVRV